jgi:hypothetical protein
MMKSKSNLSSIDKIISKENLNNLVNECQNLLNKKFSVLEIESLVRYVKKINTNTLITTNGLTKIEDVNKYIANSYKNFISEPKAFDIKEMLKEQMDSRYVNSNKYVTSSFQNNKSSFGNLDDLLGDSDGLEKLTKILNRDSLMRDVNILIDSRYQNLSNQDRSRFSFTVISDTKNKTEGSGTIISSVGLKDMVEIEVFPFSIPYFTDADNYYKKITMSILELSASSIDAYENSQFHFIFDIEKRANLLYLTPINKVFKFHKPISRLNELTLQFGSPLSTITFEKDRLPTKNIDYNSNPMTIEFYESHSLLSGDIIYINSFETLNIPADLNIISQINTPKGHLCTRINSTIISINIDANSVKFPDIERGFLVYLGSKRILIPMRIRYIESHL